IAVSAAALTLTVVLAPVRSKAADDSANQRFEQVLADCTREGGEMLPSLIANCVMEKEKEYGKELEQLYSRLVKGAPAPKVAVLGRQQRNWLKYQKQHCDSFYYLHENEGWGPPRLSSAQCLLRTTLQRIEELRGLLP